MAEGGHSLNVSCSICFEDYKTPKVLTCGHTFCCQCVHKMVGRNSSLQCPTCRKDISLPESGKVEDFTTNFALLNLISDNKKIKESGDDPPLKVDPGCECPQHKNPTKFYCKSCKKSVCAECLLQDHKPDVHTIATTSDMAVIFSGELQKHLQQLQVYDKEGKSLGEKISEGLHCYEEDKNMLQDKVNNALERKQKKLKKSAENLIKELNKKAEGCTRAFTDLQTKHSKLCDLSSKIHEKCNDLHHHLKNCHLSHASKLEEISKCLETLKASTESLETTCQSTPTKIGLILELEEATCQLGKLKTMSNTPTIMQLPDKAAADEMLLQMKIRNLQQYRAQEEDEYYWIQQLEEEERRRQQEEEEYYRRQQEKDYWQQQEDDWYWQ